MMTVEQVNEKFRDAKVKFSSYYKYTFNFEGKTEDGFKIQCSFGGDSEDIYRFDVNTNEISFLHTNQWSNVTISKGDKGEIVFSEYFDW